MRKGVHNELCRSLKVTGCEEIEGQTDAIIVFIRFGLNFGELQDEDYSSQITVF